VKRIIALILSLAATLPLCLAQVPFTITTASPLPTGTIGVAYSQPLAATGGTSPYTWEISSGSPPPGLSLSASSGVLGGTPTAVGTYTFTVRVTDYFQRSATKAFTLTIVSALAISAISPTTVTAGCTGVTLTILGSGFLVGGEQGSVVQWTSPATGTRQLSPTFISSSELLLAIPDGFLTSPGTANLRILNPGGVYSNTVDFVISPAPAISAIDPAGATAGISEFTLRVIGSGFVGGTPGSTVQWLSPAGTPYELTTTFVSSTQLRAQVPANLLSTPGTARIAVINPPCGVRSNMMFFEIAPPLRVTTTALPTGTVGVAYSATLAATGGREPYGWSLTGDLGAAGLAFTAATATISGTPNRVGVIALTALVRDSSGATAIAAFTLTIVQGLSITTSPPLPNGTVGVPYSQTLAASGGTPPYSWSATGLPAGLALSSSTGALTGTPTAAGIFNFTATVTDSVKSTASKSFTLTVIGALTIVTASPLPAATVGTAYGQTLSATGGTPPYSWSSTDLPSWLTLNASTGALTGIPAAAATHSFTVRVTDSARNTATKTFALTVNPYDLAITTASPLPAGTVGTAYSVTLAATGGRAPYRWSVSAGSLPQGLSLNASTGAISGTPTAAGTTNFTVQLTDAAERTTTKSFSVTIAPRPELRFSGLGDVVQPTQQPRLQVNLVAAITTALTGRLTLTFAHDAVVPLTDNPEVQFSTGGRTVDFTIPAGQTRAQFGAAQDVGIQVGTVAGTITVSASPIGGSVQTRIARAAPAISTVRVTRTGTGFDVEIIGYATPRQVATATFRFAAPGADLQTPEVTVNVDSAFTTWYRNSASDPFGSQFRYLQPFTVTGEASAVTSVSVTLTNATGTSSAASANF